MNDIIVSIITSISAGSLAGAVLLYLSRAWLSERLKQSIEHEYQTKLESHKAILKAEQETAIERFRLEAEKERAIRTLATESMMTSRQASQEARIQAIKVLWESVVTLKSDIPAYVGLSDLLHESQWNQFNTHPPLKSLLEDLDPIKIKDIVFEPTKEIENFRPFIGELIYSYFFSYRAFIGSILVSFYQGKDNGEFKPWHTKEEIVEMLNSTLGSDIVKNILTRKAMIFSEIQQEFEKQILQHCSKVLSGEESATFGLDQAAKIQASASHLMASSHNPYKEIKPAP